MTIWDIIPTCDDEMSHYTLVALCIFATVGFVIATTAYWWASNELKELKKSVNGHDTYIKETAKVFSKIQTKLAVQESSMETLKEDISEIKTDVKTLLRR
jgi:septal ring factor EnvC (AmiA/AmiB activator)